MNDELKQWIKEFNKKVEFLEKDKYNNCKNISGKCQICGENTAEHICIICEKFVCKSCYFKIIGICKKCIPSNISNKWNGSSPIREK